MSEKHGSYAPASTMSGLLAIELKHHVPFTAIGAAMGIAVMGGFVLARVPHGPSEVLFEIMHPAHVLLSAVVTTAMFRRYRPSLPAAIVTGLVAAVGIGTLSDIVLPYFGGELVGAKMEHIHLAFIEEWWLVWPAAAIGVGVGLWRPGTRLPHSAHVFVSTWASLFYLISYGEASNWLPLLPAVFLLLFAAVWLPCCFGDIIFPLLIAGRKHADREHQH
ncbi:MAG: hypothetical protein FJ291_02465 [Planctomycetes bacterium]|nr:hypothetical protein [Planctomycetota bacterium]